MRKHKKLLIFLISAVCVILVIVIVFCALYFREEEQVSLTGNYYNPFNVTLSEYTRNDADYTIKEYGAANEVDMLYFDWYEEEDLEFVYDFIYTDGNGEEFCFYEDIDKGGDAPDACLAEIYIFKEGSGADFSEKGASNGIQTTTINGVEFEWIFVDDHMACQGLHAKAHYNGYLYCITLTTFVETAEDGLELLPLMFH